MITIEDLFNDNVRPAENMSFNKTYRTALIQLGKNLKTLEDKLPEEDKELVEKIRSEYTTVESEATLHAFTHGFSLGIRLAAECYNVE